MNYLIVIAHPDDEVLGAGGTIYKATRAGHTVTACILSSESRARYMRPSDEELDHDMHRAAEILGISRIIPGYFPNIQLNNVPHLELVQFIEGALSEVQPDVVITHHPSDSNNDHAHVFLATQEAIRLFQRRENIKPVDELLLMEVPSTTDWDINPAGHPFTPNTFVEIGEAGLAGKLEALRAYRGVARPYPHPRSEEAIRGLAAVRGAQAGLVLAEAFQSAFRRVR